MKFGILTILCLIAINAFGISDSAKVKHLFDYVSSQAAYCRINNATDSVEKLKTLVQTDFEKSTEWQLIKALNQICDKKFNTGVRDLKQIKSNSHSNYIKALASFHLGRSYRKYLRSDSCITYFEQAISIAKSINDSNIIGLSNYNLGRFYEDSKNYKSAIIYYNNALDLFKSNTRYSAITSKSLGIVFRKMSLFLPAVEQYNEALKQYLKSNDHYGVASVYNSMGILSTTSSHFNIAKQYFYKALFFNKKINTGQSIQLNIYNNIGICLVENSEYDSAIIYLEKALEIAKNQGNLGEASKSVNNLAIAFKGLGLYQKAIVYYHTSIRFRKLSNSKSGIEYSYLGLANLHTRIQHLDSAAFYFKLVNKNIKRAHSSKLLNDYYEYYSNYLKARGNLELSYTYLDSAHKNSRTNSQGLFTEQIANYQILFDAQKDEFEKQQLKISLLQEQKTLAKTYSKLAFQKKIIYLSLIILLLALIIISFYYFAKRRIDIVNSKLKSVNNQLTDSLSENKALVGIIAHDLKSPFGQIKGLIDILEDEQELNHTYLAMIKRSCANGNDLVNDLITAHKVETIETTLSKFDLSSFIGELKTNYSVLAAQKGITLNIDIKHSFEVLSDRRLLYRVFDNLITNAIKFSQKNETISITAEQKNQEIKLCVIDNGPGIDSNEQKIIFEKFKRGKSKPTAGESSSGLGLYITKLICQKLNHQLLLTSKIGKGSNFCIIINNEQA